MLKHSIAQNLKEVVMAQSIIVSMQVQSNITQTVMLDLMPLQMTIQLTIASVQTFKTLKNTLIS